MALIYDVTLRPSKLDLLIPWLAEQPWAEGLDGALERAASFRFDDPEGEVGVETLLIGAGGALVQVPLTYRGAPVEGLEEHLVGTLDHPALGQRWVYDAVADPVYLAAMADAVLDGAPQAGQFHEVDGELVEIEPTVSLEWNRRNRRASATVRTDVVELATPRGPVLLFRVLDPRAAALGRTALLASRDDWTAQVAAAG
ncbi:hypothetical protein D6T63_13155 [Arthrobacter cheniae]|uniref:Maltokinase N-terminal cap domain-containing protein n=1 Tax=Arthrobacter cheniae TaxID=1258888 RepID=A0A3A5MCC3_9MICC|nr:hypothetical protein [Arthrobacter cheniae]RJT78449.1 hypothetical protein D6T63_13155 [Arthrobacter cheniae]